MLGGHFAFRHHGDLNGPCESCGEPLAAHEYFIVDDDGPNDVACTVAPVSEAASFGYRIDAR